MVYIKSYLKSEDTDEAKIVLPYGTKKISLTGSENDLIEAIRSEMEEQCLPRGKNNINLSLDLNEYEELNPNNKQDGSEIITRIYKASGKKSDGDGSPSEIVLVFEVKGPRELLDNL
jgi:hypothetical protein